MIGKILTEENKKLLELIYCYGGYVRVYHLQKIYPGISHRGIQYKLSKLVDMKYLTKRRLKTNSKSEPVTFQVTKSACRLFLNPDSYYRKKHQEEYVYRSLVRSYFCFENYRELGTCILADHNERVKKFKKGNFNEEFFPKKHNKDTSFVHFEEFMIDFTQREGKQLTCNQNVLYDDLSSRIIILYVDQQYKDAKKQIYFIVNRYLDLVDSGGDFNIDFLVTVDSEDRKSLYEKEIKGFIDRHTYKDRISDRLEIIYLNYICKYLDNDEKVEQIEQEYNTGEFKNMLIERAKKIKINALTEQQKIIQSEILSKGDTYIISKVKEIVRTSGGLKKSHELVETFFDNLFSLEYNNYFSLNKKRRRLFDIKVYKISKKIHE